jgi:Zn-dependent peptidase ImmA (M78 family)
MKHEKLRPNSVRIMGRNYVVIYEDKSLLGNGAVGMCNAANCLISVMEEQHPVEEADTLLHEILHAIWHCMGIQEGSLDEERVVRMVASGLMTVMMDNPQLLKYFQAVQNPPHLEL